MAQEFTRQQLYDLVWAEPLTKLAARLGMSGNGLKKVCRHAEIPVPEVGHWARVNAGKAVTPRALPPRGLGMSDTMKVGKVDYYGTSDEENRRLLTEPVEPPAPFAEPIAEVRDRVRKLVGNVPVPNSFSRTHPLISRFLQEDQHRTEAQRASGSAFSWKAPLFDSPPGRRRLRVLNALSLALQRCGATPSVYPDPERRNEEAASFVAKVGDRNVYFTLETLSERGATREPSASGSKKATGRLRLTIKSSDRSGAAKVWEDKESAPIEASASDIVTELIVAGEESYRLGLQRLYEWRLERKAELEEEARRQKAEELRRRREREAAEAKRRLDHLFSQASNWQRANDVRGFVEAVRLAKRSTEPAFLAQIDRWAVWALAEADRIDPLAQGGPTLPEERTEQAP